MLQQESAAHLWEAPFETGLIKWFDLLNLGDTFEGEGRDMGELVP